MKTSRTKQSKAPETTPAKPKAVKKKPAAAKGEAEKPKARSMRAPSRLPSAADVEAVAEQGPPIVKILRLIQLRAALLEAQAADEDVARTG